MTGKTQAWGAALLAVAVLLLLLVVDWPSALVGAAAGWLLGARQEWAWEKLKGVWAALSARLAPKPAVRGFISLPRTSDLPWLRIGVIVLGLAFVAWIVIGVFGLFRDAGCAVRSLTPWPCETKESLRAERDDLRGRLETESANANVRDDALDLADQSQTRDRERSEIVREATAQILNRPPHPPALEAHPNETAPSPPPSPDPSAVYSDALRNLGMRDVPEPAGSFGVTI